MTDGKPALTDETLALKAAGGAPYEATGLSLDRNIIGLGGDMVNPNDKMPVDLFTSEEALSKAYHTARKRLCTALWRFLLGRSVQKAD